MPDFSFDFLRRRPDVEALNLSAWDAADELLLDTAAGAIRERPDAVVVMGDRYGALTLGAHALHGAVSVRTHQDGLSGVLALQANAAAIGLSGEYAHHPLGPGLLEDARTVLLQLPRSLDELDEAAWHIARWAHPDVTVLAGGRTKHMNLSMNGVLQRHFGTVTAGLARRKARIVTAQIPITTPHSGFPATARHEVGLAGPLTLCAYGGTFGGPALDPGTRFLLPFLAGAKPVPNAIDLGSGNGTIAVFLALSRPELRVRASDQSASAVQSTRATAAANGVADRVTAVQDDALAGMPDASAGLIVLNPPFHLGNTVHAGIAHKLFADAGRVLEPAGELWTVWNSLLRYRPVLEKLVGPTRQVGRNPKFTVMVSTKPPL
ncbi:methyltransferase [Arthrobacter sp. H5]|uniref:class I SAM-dependent methyltransferase n=1 Tax=Arthrobacter sp. H5 TaxID=1267973 RepID=UPI000486ABFF|nr:methyltransferase [Arthrobacter sp. H5]